MNDHEDRKLTPLEEAHEADLRELGRTTSALGATVRGMSLNRVLYQGQVFISGGNGPLAAAGIWSITLPDAFGFVVVANDSGSDMWASADEPDDRIVGNPAGQQRIGGFFVPKTKVRGWPMTGNVFTLYGAGGTFATVGIYVDALPVVAG